mgnify:CR=1 FL=1
MSHNKGTYIIPLQSLLEGVHEIAYKIDKEFIELHNIERMSDVNLEIKIEFTKRSQVHTLKLFLQGKAEVECDRCLDPILVKVRNEQTFVVKVGVENDNFTDSEDVILIAPDDIEIDLSHILYESLLLALPLKNVHAETKCNKTMLSYLQKGEKQENKEQHDSRWDSLKNIFEN